MLSLKTEWFLALSQIIQKGARHTHIGFDMLTACQLGVEIPGWLSVCVEVGRSTGHCQP